MLQIANIRRGFAAGARGDPARAARAMRGSIELSSGKASTMPAPRRKLRRESGWRVAPKGAGGGGSG